MRLFIGNAVTPVDRTELPGMEFDWLAADEAGQLAQMLSSGVGRIPEVALHSEETLFALHLYLDELPISEALSVPEGSFQALLAQPQRRGLFVYDAHEQLLDPSGRTAGYARIAAPARPLTIDRLPVELQGVIARISGRFDERPSVEIEGI